MSPEKRNVIKKIVWSKANVKLKWDSTRWNAKITSERCWWNYVQGQLLGYPTYTINSWLLECLMAGNVHHYNHGHPQKCYSNIENLLWGKFTAVKHIKAYKSHNFTSTHSFLLPVTVSSLFPSPFFLASLSLYLIVRVEFESPFFSLFYLWVMMPCWCILFFAFALSVLVMFQCVSVYSASF